MGLKQYRTIDLTILFIIMCVLEVASLLVLHRNISSFYLSIVLLVTLIVYMRWNFYGCIFGIVGGIIDAVLISSINSIVDPNAMAMSAVVKWSIAYVVGYLMTAVSMAFFKMGKKKFSSNLIYIFFYVLSAYILMCLGRSLVFVFYGENFFEVLISNFTREALNLVFTFLVLLVAKRQDSIFADQKEYFETHKVRR